MRMLNLLPAVVLLVGLTACERRDMSHPLYVKARKYLQENDFATAAKCFSQYLKLNPESAEAHKELGTIYDDRLKEPGVAIYHYRKFLEFAPANHPDRVTVVSWIEASEHKYYLLLKDRYNDPNDLKSTRIRFEMSQEELTRIKSEAAQYRTRIGEYIDRIKQDNHFIARIKQQMAALQKETSAEVATLQQRLQEQQQQRVALDRAVVDARNVNLALQQEIGRWKERAGNMEKAAVAALKEIENNQEATGPRRNDPANRDVIEALLTQIRESDRTPQYLAPHTIAEGFEKTRPERPLVMTVPEVQPAPLTQGERAAAAATVPPAAAKVYYYTVKSGDTLSSISKKFYGGSRHYELIIEANKRTLPNPAALRPGQVLEIPAMPSTP